jgi:uncharacterized membrane protein YbaN (DUF454 family)
MTETRRNPHATPNGWKRWLLIGLGWTFILLGIAGLVLPVLQGILFLAIGALLLAAASYRVRRWLVTLRRRYPAFGAALDAGRGWLRRHSCRKR